MKVFKGWKFKRKLIHFKDSIGHMRIDKKTVIFSLFSFILGYFFNKVQNIDLKLSNRDIYFGDSPSYRTVGGFSDVFLVVLVFSSVDNFSRREVIRNTWLSGVKDTRIVHFFVISAGTATKSQKSALENEQEKYKDLLIFTNLDDSFYLLTSKLLVSFGWLVDIPVMGNEGRSPTKKYFNEFQYVLKCDDDTFIRVPDVVNELSSKFSREKGKNLYWGFFDGRARPKKAGKYKELEWNICDHYIPYAVGGGYVLSYSLVHFIARNGNFLKKYKNEDISVGAWLSSYNDLNRVHEPRFDTEYSSRGCHQSYLMTHKHSEAAMKNFHDSLKNNGQLCQKEFRSRISYNYNWNVPPSKCCARNNPDIP